MVYDGVQFLLHGFSITVLDCEDEDALYSTLTPDLLDYLELKGIHKILYGRSSEYSIALDEDLKELCKLNSEE